MNYFTKVHKVHKKKLKVTVKTKDYTLKHKIKPFLKVDNEDKSNM